MRIAYIAFDGKEFNREEDCREYEERLRNTFVMWNREALETTNPDYAVFVLLKSEGAGAAFIKACDANGTYSAGIQEVILVSSIGTNGMTSTATLKNLYSTPLKPFYITYTNSWGSL